MTNSSEAINTEITVYLSSAKTFYNNRLTSINNMIHIADELSTSLCDPNYVEDHDKEITEKIDKIAFTVNTVRQEHKKLHTFVSKIGKSIEKNFETNFTSLRLPENESEDFKSRLNKAIMHIIADHFMRIGHIDISKSLIRKTQLNIKDEDIFVYVQMSEISIQLKEYHNLKPLLRWCQGNSQKLNELSSCLFFSVHRLIFLNAVYNSVEISELVKLSTNFAPFMKDHKIEILKLLGYLLYTYDANPDISNYNNIFKTRQIPNFMKCIDIEKEWDSLHTQFIDASSKTVGLSRDCPLEVLYRVGIQGLGPLLNIRNLITKNNYNNIWRSTEELPISVDLLDRDYYHSLFACPILKQHTTEANPPVILKCCHVISHEAVSKLKEGNRIKCPYCPIDQSPKEVRSIVL
ncbi:hypothetical protein A3Q56_02674 [Intoshia linei]|uniref:RING-Gid-type domain-containing protein n=1 Tax=Intoshia linei TaxID=1819745 RepID=A0A177B5K2_9BILA|nr:hypothetical protein A3Q56_02674 [Intoshia linei]